MVQMSKVQNGSMVGMVQWFNGNPEYIRFLWTLSTIENDKSIVRYIFIRLNRAVSMKT